MEQASKHPPFEPIPDHPRRLPGRLICVSGPSGVGKGTVIAQAKTMSAHLVHSVSITTRPPRPGEIEGISYYFRTQEAFEQLLEQGEILEYDVYCDHYYGTPLAPIEQKLAAGVDVIMDVTVPGSLATLANYPDAVSIFLLPPSMHELHRRLTGRGTETPDRIAQRMSKATAEIAMAPRFKYILINEDVRMTALSILNIVDAEKHLAIHQPGIEEKLLKS